MFGFNFQSKMLQSESLVAQLAQVQFDSILEKYYSDAGEAGAFGTDALSITAILLNKSKVFASYQKKANMPQPLNYLNLWAAEGLSNLMYAKSDPATGLPALWTQTPKTTKELISLFQPFFGAIDLVQHAKTMQYALNVYGKPFTIPQDLVDAITASAKSKKAVGQKSLAVLALTSVMDKTLVLYERPVYAKDGKTLTRTETCFLTRNIQILEALAKQGIISVPDGVDITAALTEKLEKVVKDLFGDEKAAIGNVTKRALQAECVPCVKLVFERNSAGRDVFSMTVPPSGLDITSPDARVLPVRFMYKYCEGLIGALTIAKTAEIASNHPVDGPYTVKVTPSADVFKSVYSDCDPAAVESRAQLPIGYSLRRGRLILFNLENSVYSTHGYASINPFNITNIKAIDTASINRLVHALDPISVNAYFVKAVSVAKPADLEEIIKGIPSLDEALTKFKLPHTADGVSQVLGRAKLPLLEIVTYMKNVDRNCITNIKSSGTRSTVAGVPLEGATDEEKAKNLYALLNTGIICIKYEGNNGASDILATELESELVKVWGMNYQLERESWAHKCDALRSRVLRDGLSKTQISQLVEKYKITGLDISKLVSNSIVDFDKWVSDAAAARKQTTPKPDIVTVRCLNRQEPFFKSLKLSGIKSVAKIK